jgi:hypothetical protein
MRLDARTAAVMRKASQGPAAIALRQSRITRGLPATAPITSNGGSFGTLYRRAGTRIPNPYKLGALGASQLVSTVASKGGAIAATSGGSSIAAAMGAGAAAGPIGLVVGAIVGIVIAKIFNKQYLDVTSANTIADASLGVFKQYQGIAGQVAGRDIGLASMNAIWKGALYAGLFPLNNQQLCFHNGCLKYRGQPEWIEATINGPDNAFTLGGNYQNFLMGIRNASVPAASSGPATAYTAPIASRSGMLVRAGFQGLGALGAVNGVPEAVVLVDQYLIPSNTRDNPAWLVPRSALEHQILYDVADAWLAQKHPELTTTPYITSAPTVNTVAPEPAPTPIPAPITPVPIAPGQPAPVVTPYFPSEPPIQTITAPGGGNFSPQPFNPIAPAPITPISAAPPGTAVAAATGLPDIFSNPLMLLVIAGVGIAVVMGLKDSK